MAESRRLEGVIDLPREILVASEALGQSVQGHTGLDAFTLFLPSLADPFAGNWMYLNPPYFDDHEVLGLLGQRTWGRPSSPERMMVLGPSWVHSVVVRIDAEPLGRQSDGLAAEAAGTADAFGQRFAVWYGRFAAWLEIWTPQRLMSNPSGEPKLRGRVFFRIDENVQLTGWGEAFGPVELYHARDAVTLKVLRAAAAKASLGASPPLEWQLLIRALRYDDDRRQSVIDAASAAEVAMAQAARAKLGSVPDKAIEAIIQSANGVAGMVELLEAIDEATGKSWRSRVAARLAGPRNDAAHRGLTPSHETTTEAIAQAIDLVNKYSPRPNPDDT
ncbi:hypothetical protein [Kribbella sp. CA-294648]|uniref:hypothetical protein n=1 Tax=Kribbella sp. CA-294648 TaxID=3239948 RepID=UPI003D8ABAA1